MKINRTELIDKFTAWFEDLKRVARKDESFLISWFSETKEEPFAIIAGWMEGFKEENPDLYCISKSNPDYAMCIKIAINDGPYAYTDFEVMNMPYDEDTNEVDDTCIAMEWDDNPEAAAVFFLGEWERIMEEHGEK